MELIGTHTHATLGTFQYTAEYSTRQPESTWFVDWSGTAIGAGRVLQLSGGCIEILAGSSGAAPLLVEKQICKEIDSLT